ncbi:MAG TPA: hypothetical protein VHO48_10505 [Anaerolineaceae bacterium]|nr:hypothetical protein [Anaerolineaceae bacterium]
MLDHRYGERTQDVFRTGPVFMPTWYPRYNPVYRSAGGAAPISTSSSSGGKGVSLPHLPGSDFAASVVNGAQAFSAGVIGDLTSFTSGVTNQTNPVPKTTYTSSRGGGGGGHSCACACACAGCACACAGGGR